ncbi:MAG: hypothetical protein ACRCVV_12515 [Shewanella sp.]
MSESVLKMRLNYTDVRWAEFRLTADYARLLRATEVVTRYVFSFSDSELLLARDLCYIKFAVPSYEVCGVSDSIMLSYAAVIKDSILLPELFSVRLSTRLFDLATPVELVSVTCRSPFSEAAIASDSTSFRYAVFVRDAVGYNESFFFGGRFNVDVNNLVFTSDGLAAEIESPRPDLAVVAEFVRVGIRHMIDFYFGGFTMGSVVLGGRVR